MKRHFQDEHREAFVKKKKGGGLKANTKRSRAAKSLRDSEKGRINPNVLMQFLFLSALIWFKF